MSKTKLYYLFLAVMYILLGRWKGEDKMKVVVLHIPTTIKETKEFFLDKIKWFIHPKRMKHNKKILNEVAYEICKELTSNYWSKDISEEMKSRLTNRYTGKIYDIIFNKKKELI